MMKFIYTSLMMTILCFSQNSFALTLKIGALAPEGTTWAKNLKKMSREIKKKTDGKVKLKIYYGGSQGDEPVVLRKIRVGQTHGGIFTGKTLGDINGDVRIMEVPFLFNADRDKAWNVLGKMTPHFDRGFEKNKFKNLGFFEIGMVYFVSQKKTMDLEGLKGVKIWSWEGDPLVETLINTMKLVSVPLALPDVLSSLSTGIIEAAYAPPIGIIALQWNTKVKYLVNFPITYSLGAFLVSMKSWKKISPAHQKIVEETSQKYIAKIVEAGITENQEALKVMKSMGIEFIEFPAAEVKKSQEYRKEIISKLKGKLFSAETLKKFNSLL